MGAQEATHPRLPEMQPLSLAISIVCIAFEAVLIWRAARGGFFSKFPLFHSYIAYMFSGAVVCMLTLWLRPEAYANVYWFYFLIIVLAEFGVLVEVSDLIFEPHAAVRQLARLLIVGLCIASLLLSILPAVLETRPLGVTFLNLVKLSALLKVVAIAALLSTALFYRIPLGRNVSGIMLGFAVYLSVAIANYAAAAEFGKADADVLSWLHRGSYAMCLLIWTISLWRYEPGHSVGRQFSDRGRTSSEPVAFQLTRFNAALERLLRK